MTEFNLNDFKKCVKSFEYFALKYVKVKDNESGGYKNIREFIPTSLSRFPEPNFYMLGKEEEKIYYGLSYILWYSIFFTKEDDVFTSWHNNCFVCSSDMVSSKKSIQILIDMLEELPEFFKLKIKKRTVTTIEFENGNNIIFTDQHNFYNSARVGLIHCVLLDDYGLYTRENSDAILARIEDYNNNNKLQRREPKVAVLGLTYFEDDVTERAKGND